MSRILNIRLLDLKDRQRIGCQGLSATEDCDRKADVCDTVNWDTGNTKGISFFYSCFQCLFGQLGIDHKNSYLGCVNKSAGDTACWRCCRVLLFQHEMNSHLCEPCQKLVVESLNGTEYFGQPKRVKAKWGNYYFKITRKFMSDLWIVSYVQRDFESRESALKVAERLATNPTKEEKLAVMEGRFVD